MSQAFEAAFSFLATAVPPDAAFVVVRLSGTDQVSIREAIQAANDSTLSTRLCIALGRATLNAVDLSDVNSERTGLMLDGVDSETPLADIANDSLEAVRFDPEFVERAARNLRQSYVLETMLGFARNLGMCTLGPRLENAGALMAQGSDFDYVSDASSHAQYVPAAATEVSRRWATALRSGQLTR